MSTELLIVLYLLVGLGARGAYPHFGAVGKVLYGYFFPLHWCLFTWLASDHAHKKEKFFG